MITAVAEKMVVNSLTTWSAFIRVELEGEVKILEIPTVPLVVSQEDTLTYLLNRMSLEDMWTMATGTIVPTSSDDRISALEDAIVELSMRLI